MDGDFAEVDSASLSAAVPFAEAEGRKPLEEDDDDDGFSAAAGATGAGGGGPGPIVIVTGGNCGGPTCLAFRSYLTAGSRVSTYQ